MFGQSSLMENMVPVQGVVVETVVEFGVSKKLLINMDLALSCTWWRPKPPKPWVPRMLACRGQSTQDYPTGQHTAKL